MNKRKRWGGLKWIETEHFPAEVRGGLCPPECSISPEFIDLDLQIDRFHLQIDPSEPTNQPRMKTNVETKLYVVNRIA